ncbi:MAG: hypothetical protein JJT78_18335 [Leptospira sp.]|nr:hypothetical protein [Leptospira sp.]
MNDASILDIYQVTLSSQELKAARKELWVQLGLAVFFCLMVCLMIGIAIMEFPKQILVNKNYYFLFFILPVLGSCGLAYYFVNSFLKTNSIFKEGKGLHFEGIVLANYHVGSNSLFYRLVLGDRSISCSFADRHDIKVGDRIVLVTLDDDPKLDNPTSLAYYRWDSIGRRTDGGNTNTSINNSINTNTDKINGSPFSERSSGIRKGKIYSVARNDEHAWEKNPYKRELLGQWRKKFPDASEPKSLDEFLDGFSGH